MGLLIKSFLRLRNNLTGGAVSLTNLIIELWYEFHALFLTQEWPSNWPGKRLTCPVTFHDKPKEGAPVWGVDHSSTAVWWHSSRHIAASTHSSTVVWWQSDSTSVDIPVRWSNGVTVDISQSAHTPVWWSDGMALQSMNNVRRMYVEYSNDLIRRMYVEYINDLINNIFLMKILWLLFPPYTRLF